MSHCNLPKPLFAPQAVPIVRKPSAAQDGKQVVVDASHMSLASTSLAHSVTAGAFSAQHGKGASQMVLAADAAQMAAKACAGSATVCAASAQDGKEVVFGANVSQTRAIEELQKASQPEPFHRIADHLLRIAGAPTAALLMPCPLSSSHLQCRR